MFKPFFAHGAQRSTRSSVLSAVLTGVLWSSWTFSGAVHADETLDKIQSRHKISVGVLLTGLPFGTVDPSTGAHVGYTVDLAKGIAEGLNVELETVSVLAPNRVQFLQQGRVDILIANMGFTDERAKILGFVPTPYEQIGGALLTRKDSGIKDWSDLKGKKVCASQGGRYNEPLIGQYHADLKAFRAQSESLLALRGGGCDAAVHISPTMHALLEKPEWKDYHIGAPTDLEPASSVIWVRKGQSDTIAKLDAIVRQWHASGWLIETGRRDGLHPSAALLNMHEVLSKNPEAVLP